MVYRALGYAGHKTAKETLPPSLKAGETVQSLATKFALAKDFPNNQEPTRLNFVSTDKQSFNNVKQGDFHVPDKRGISAKFLDSVTLSKPFHGQTMVTTEIRAGAADVHEFLSIPDEALKEAFDREADKHGLVDTRKSKAIVTSASGMGNKSLPRWIVDKFSGFFCRFGTRPDGLCDWAEFLQAIQAVRQSCSLDASTKPVGFPQWIKDSKKVPHRVVTVMDTKSAYQYEINAPEDQPRKRNYTYKTTMAGTTLDLQTGTTKHTYNLTGYGGSIPHSLRHETLRRHTEGRKPHPPRSDLLLSYHNNLAGYTGHYPIFALDSAKPRDFSNCPLTSQGAAVLGLML